MILIYEKFLGIDSPALKWKLPNRNLGNIVRFSRSPGKAKKLLGIGWTYTGKPDRLCFSVQRDALLVGVRLFGDQGGSEYQATFEVKEATVIGRYTSQRNEDDVPGFDVMLKEHVRSTEAERSCNSFYNNKRAKFVSL
jgi:hypothetical protein